MRVAIIGSGITGLAAARALASRHAVTIFEAAERPGGHVYTVDTPDGPVDMGFIVHNRDNYPRFCALLDELGIATRPTTMSFSVAHDGLEWGSATLGDLFAQRWRLIDPRHWRLLVEVVALLRRARRDVAALGESRHSVRPDDGGLAGASLDEYLARTRVSREVRDRFVVPLAAALWSLAPEQCGEFPAVSYFRFLDQHGMLSPVRPLAWRTIVGGSRTYVDALLARLARQRVDLRLGARVERIERRAAAASGAVTIISGRREECFDRAIVATHADTALALLAEPTDDERRVLGAFRYSINRTVLHTDRRLLPARVHASWNYVADPDTARVAVTYSMTKLQGLPDAPYLVTLNPRSEPRGVLHEVTFAHPQFDRVALAAQREVPTLPGPVAFAGAHLGFGFHEDGMRAGEQAAARIEADARASRTNVHSMNALAEAE